MVLKLYDVPIRGSLWQLKRYLLQKNTQFFFLWCQTLNRISFFLISKYYQFFLHLLSIRIKRKIILQIFFALAYLHQTDIYNCTCLQCFWELRSYIFLRGFWWIKFCLQTFIFLLPTSMKIMKLIANLTICSYLLQIKHCRISRCPDLLHSRQITLHMFTNKCVECGGP